MLKSITYASLAACSLIGPLATAVGAQENSECLECHGKAGLAVQRDGRDVSLFVDAERYAASVHKSLDCIACHMDLDGVEEYPHERGLERVYCMDCHEDEDGPVAAYVGSTHGRLAEDGDTRAPLCQDCHGDHEIVRLSRRDSAVSPLNIALMCTQCHVEGVGVERAYGLSMEEAFQRYPQRLHGYGLDRQGLEVTAVCTSCHGGHAVLPPDDPASSINAANVTATCTACHGRLEQVHRDVLPEESWAAGGAQRLCVDCHLPHATRRVLYGTNMGDAECLACHSRPEIAAEADGRSLFVDAEEHRRSIHGRQGVSCAQCHAGATPSEGRSCATIEGPVSCVVCHAGEVNDYGRGVHGKLHAAGDINAPYCTDCHGRHDILEHAAPHDAPDWLKALARESPTHTRNVPALCAECHRDGAPAAERYRGPETQIIEHYSMSIHGKGLLESGLTVTAVCTDCHTPHMELPRGDPDSTVHENNIAATCGRCHDGIYEQYQVSVHSKEANPEYVALRGMPELPHCNDCHSSHTMARTDRAEFALGIVEQCGKCHEEITDTYFETYHGKASALGDVAKAKCHDCHGAHDILPPEDPHSTLHADNIVATCAECHPAAHEQFTGYLTHANHHDREKYPGLFYAFWAMTILLVGVFSFFGLHLLAWLPRSWALRKEHAEALAALPPDGKQYRRFNRFNRGLHFTMVLSFFGLAITGMVLKFSYAPWARSIATVLGGVAVAGWIHRLCAVITFGYMTLHLWDVARRFRRSGKTVREFFLGPDTILPTFGDVREFAQTIKWFMGRGPMPRYGRWTYWEKFDYFAVFWGVMIIGSTGLLLWLPELFTHVLPGWTVNVATIIHSDEALLATGFIFTIHFFNTHFRPEKFPMDPVVFTGRMTLRELEHDRPRLYEQLVESGELEKDLVDPAPQLFTRGVRVFAFGALFVGFTLVALILYTMLFM